MSWVATAIAAGSVGSALIGANASKNAARTAADAAAANRPEPVNVDEAMQKYIASITNPALQGAIMGAEAEFRPGYAALNATDLQAGLIGTGGSRGALDFVSMSADRMAELNQRLATQNTEYVLDQLKSYGPEATAAYLAANPAFARSVAQMESLGGRQVSGYLNAMGDLAMQPGTGQQIVARGINAPANVRADQIAVGGTLTPERVAAERIAAGQVQAGTIGAGALGESLYQQALRGQEMSPVSAALQQQALQMAQAPGGITPDEMRAATQGARERFAGTGRLADNASIAGEALARAGASRERQMQDLAQAQQINQQLLGAQQMGQQLATDVLRTDIGRQQANVGTQLQAGQFNVDAALRAALSNQQTGLQAGLANQQTGMQAGMFNIQNVQEVARLNQAANLQAALANQQMGFNVSQLGSQQDLQAQLANRQFGLDELTARFNRLNTTTGMEQNMLNADRAYAERLAATLGNITPTAINLAGIGQNAAAIPLGFTGYGAGLDLSRDTGPRLFNPDTGVNIALGNQSNQAGYGAAVAGGAASMAGARAGATASMAGSFAQSLPYLAGMMKYGGQPTSTKTPPG